jgi:tetratricopeptide (TPR) repeat protein
MKTRGFSFRLTTVSLLTAAWLLSCANGYNKYADEYYEQGMLFYDRMEYDRSVDSFSKVLELAPQGKENHKVYYGRGKAYLRSRQYDRALYDLTKALELTPEGDREMKFLALEMRGDAFQGNRQFENAVQDYSVALSLLPGHANAKHVTVNRGWAFFNAGRPDEAIQDFSRAIAMDPKLDDAYYGRGRCWLVKRDPERALADAKEALKLRPEIRRYDDFLHEIRSAGN